MIMKPEMNVKNKITAVGASAILVLRYSFGTINWRLEEIKKIDRRTRKILLMYIMLHLKVDRLYVKRKYGGRHLSQTSGK